MSTYGLKKILLTVILGMLFLVPNSAFAGWGYNYSADQDCNTELGSTPTLADGSVLLYKYPWSAFSTAFNQKEYKAIPTLNMVNCINDGTNHIMFNTCSALFGTGLVPNQEFDAMALQLSPTWKEYATPAVDLEWWNNINTNFWNMGNSVADNYLQVSYGGHNITLIAWALRDSASTSYYSLIVMTMLVDGNVASNPIVNNQPYRSMAYYHVDKNTDFILAGADQGELYLIVKQPTNNTDANATAAPIINSKNFYTASGNLTQTINQMAVAVQKNDNEGTAPAPTPQTIPHN